MKLLHILTMMAIVIAGAKADWFGDSFGSIDVNGGTVGDANYLQCVNAEGAEIGSVEIVRASVVHSRVYCISWYDGRGCDEEDRMGRMTWDMSRQGGDLKSIRGDNPEDCPRSARSAKVAMNSCPDDPNDSE